RTDRAAVDFVLLVPLNPTSTVIHAAGFESVVQTAGQPDSRLQIAAQTAVVNLAVANGDVVAFVQEDAAAHRRPDLQSVHNHVGDARPAGAVEGADLDAVGHVARVQNRPLAVVVCKGDRRGR